LAEIRQAPDAELVLERVVRLLFGRAPEMDYGDALDLVAVPNHRPPERGHEPLRGSVKLPIHHSAPEMHCAHALGLAAVEARSESVVWELVVSEEA